MAHFGRESGWSAKSAVTLVVTKAPGVNAGDVNERARAFLGDFSARLLPASTHIEITRDAGRAATDRVETLMEHMLPATLIVVLLIAVALGRREALIVAIVIPVTLAIVPFVYWLAGFTLNRITLAAMLFAIGILVDDAIVIIENIHRHFQSGSTLSPMEAAIEAVQEVGNPTILATFAVVGALLPTAFVTGMVGQYLRPLPVGASVAMLFSLVVALTVTPFLALDRKVARGRFGPVVRLEASAGRFDAPYSITIPLSIPGVEVPPIQVRGRDTACVTASLVQPIGSLWTIAEAHRAQELGEQAAKAEQVATRNDVVLEVVEAYVQALEAERMQGIAEGAVHQIEAHLEQARQLQLREVVARREVLKAEVVLSEAQSALAQARAGGRLARLNLALQLIRVGSAIGGRVLPHDRDGLVRQP